MQLEPQVRVVPEAGGVMIFSGNQLHSTVPNTSGRTRFSIDFRTVNIDDVVVASRGAERRLRVHGYVVARLPARTRFRADRRRRRTHV